MKNFAVAKRYSSALWQSAKDVATAEKWLKNLEEMIRLGSENADLDKLLSSPMFASEKKAAVLADILKVMQVDGHMSAFLTRILSAGRFSSLRDITELFRLRLLTEKGVIELQVESALPLSDAQKTDLVSRFEKMTGKKIQVVSKVSKELLAGMKVSYGGKTFDGTLKTHLNNLGKYLLKEDSLTHATA
ncbi:MAG: ATP synthase F1 subunit delta [Bdellovibrionales bacterium]|nr:ATP synthase F1 subunit delta [Bdellovibrionales bacterium]